MSKNSELVNELRNGNNNREAFFKKKIKEELEKSGIKSDEITINDIFNKALDTYTDDIKIPFLFHIKAVINNSNHNIKKDTGSLSNDEYKVIKLYLNMNEDKYLSRIEIANHLGMTLDEVIIVLNKLNSNNKDIERLFPDYKEKIKLRNAYFEKKTTILSERQINILLNYCNFFGKNMDLKELAKKYNVTSFDMKYEIIRIFKLLNHKRNLEYLIKNYPTIKDELIKKSKELNIQIKNIDNITITKEKITTNFTRKIFLNNTDLKVLSLINNYDKKEISEEMIIKAGFKDIKDFIDKRALFITKIKRNSKYIEQIKEQYKDLDIERIIAEPRLTSREFWVLTLILKGYTTKEIKEETELKYLNKSIDNLYRKLKESKYLYERTLLVLPTLNTLGINFNNNINLSHNELEILKLLNDKPNLTTLEASNILGFDINNYKTRILNKIKSDKALAEYIAREFPNIKFKVETKKEEGLTEKNKQLITLLKKNLSDEKMTLELNLANKNSYHSTKKSLFRKLKNSEKAKREALKIYPELNIDKKIDGITLTFTSLEIDFLQEFCLVKNSNLIYQSMSNISKNLNLSKDTIKVARASSTHKVISNVIVGNDLNIILWPNFLNEFITRDNFKEEKSIILPEYTSSYINNHDNKDKILKALTTLENSIFKEYVNNCDSKEKLILAFRLGYFDKRFFTSNEVANLLNVDENYVIELTKDCLSKSKEAFIASNKNLSKTKK